MKHLAEHDCIVIGSGPNGLSAAIALQACGFKTHIIEKHHVPGGGLKSDDEIAPGFIRDVCAAIHPMAILSPFFRAFNLKDAALVWIYPDIPCAHPLRDNTSVALHHSLEETIAQFNSTGARRYRQLFEQLSKKAEILADEVLKPLFHVPTHPFELAKFGTRAIWPASLIARYLSDEKAAALFAGMAAHSFLPFNKFLSSAAAMMLVLAAHAKGWPVAKGGSGQIARYLLDQFQRLGGTIETQTEVLDIRALPNTATLFFDIAPKALAQLAGDALPRHYVDKLNRYRYGPAAYKVDYLLREPIPWLAKDCRRAGTVHVGGTFSEIESAEKMTWHAQTPTSPFMLVGQQSLFDKTRVHDNKQIVWSYAHVAHGTEESICERMENHIESYAPGFKDCIVAKKITSPKDFEYRNPNLIGGDIVGGIADLWQTLARPVLSLNPYRTPNPRIYLCSASTPPGAGVHGMCGIGAAESFVQTKKKGMSVLTKLRETLG